MEWIVKPETKAAVAKWLVESVLFLFYLGLNYWLVEGNRWLIWFLSSAAWMGTITGMRVAENRKLFDISDRQLVYVSGVVDKLVECIDQLEADHKEAKDELAEMDRKKRMGWT